MTTGKPLLDKLIAVRTAHPFGQFGSADDECTDNGALGCTHTVWRFIAFCYTGKWYSHDQLSRLSGFPCGGGPSNRGMRVEESLQLCKALGMPFVFKGGLSSGDLLRASNIGPAMAAIRYADWPNWKGYHGKNVPTPHARPYGKAGRNQFTGFYGSHAVALMGYKRIVSPTGVFVRNDAYVMEPNHDSPARPENVPFDIVTQSQFNRAYQGVKRLGWNNTVAIIPTRAPKFPGGLK